MSIATITAKIRCDGCNAAFDLDIDVAATHEASWSFFDAVIDTLQANMGESYQGEHMLCRNCTKIVDERTEPSPTYAEVHKALEK